MEKTLFSTVNTEISNTFKEHGFNWIDQTYINIFRWLWNDCNIFPNIDTFPSDPEKRCMISIYNPNLRKNETQFGIGYDEAIIKSVIYVYDHINDFF